MANKLSTFFNPKNLSLKFINDSERKKINLRQRGLYQRKVSFKTNKPVKRPSKVSRIRLSFMRTFRGFIRQQSFFSADNTFLPSNGNNSLYPTMLHVSVYTTISDVSESNLD